MPCTILNDAIGSTAEKGCSPCIIPGGLVSTHNVTQINVVQSERVPKAVEALGLEKRPEWQDFCRYAPDADGNASIS